MADQGGGAAGQGRTLIVDRSEAPALPVPPRRAVFGRHSRAGTTFRRALLLIVCTLGVTAIEAVTWVLTRSQGVSIVGDSPRYLITGAVLGTVHANPVPAFRHDVVAHYFYQWAPGTPAKWAGGTGIAYFGPHGPVFAQGIGVPALLAPFAWLGAHVGAGVAPFELLGFFSYVAVGGVYLHQRASHLADLSLRGQVALAAVMAAPAIWLAATQVYPDLLTGIAVACALVEIAAVERTGRLGGWHSLVVAMCLAVIPWLEVKNGALVVIVLVTFLVVGVRRRLRANRIIAVMGGALAPLGLLLFYNTYYFGHVFGLPEPPERLTPMTIAHTAALVLDRHQGLLIQVPTILLGLLGLWYSRRRTPVTAAGSLVAVCAVLAINGAQASSTALGGLSFAGRFQWTALPILLVWSAAFLRKLTPTRQLGFTAVIASLWIWQAIPIVLGEHAYFNATIFALRPWDPSLYPGWWAGLNGSLPVLYNANQHLGAVAAPLAFEVVLLGAVLAISARISAHRPLATRGTGAVVLIGAVALGGALLADRGGAGPLPPKKVWTAADFGSPWAPANTSLEAGPFPLATLGDGSYELRVVYRAAGAVPPRLRVETGTTARAMAAHWRDLSVPAALTGIPPKFHPIAVHTRRLPASRNMTSEVVKFDVRSPASLVVAATVPAGSVVTVERMTLRKL